MRRRLLVPLISIVVIAFGGLGANLLAGNSPALGLDLQGGVSVTLQPVGGKGGRIQRRFKWEVGG